MRRGQIGGVLVITLVFFAVFVVIVLAWLQFAVLGNNVTVNQEQEEQAFHIGEAGVHYTLWLLNAAVCAPGQLEANEPLVQTVTDPDTGAVVGTYEVTWTVTTLPDGESSTVVTVLGHDLTRVERCQEIEAEIRSNTSARGTFYAIYAWDHDLEVTCAAPPAPTTVTCV